MGISRYFALAYDSALLWASPRRYRIRQHFQRIENDPDYRAAVELGMNLRGYRAAKQAGEGGWMGGGSSADAEILRDLPALRNKSRMLNQDDPIGSGLTKSFVENVIGYGILPQAATGNPEKNKAIESVWWERDGNLYPTDNLPNGEGQRLAARKVYEDGEVLRKAVFSRDRPVWFETVEADRLATPPQQSTNPLIRDGVERDADGRIVAYWIMRHHPGDIFSAVATYTPENYQRVPGEWIRHLKKTERPGQTRGVPIFHAILQDIRDLDLLLVAALKRTQIAACLSVFLKTTAESEDVLDLTAKKYGYELDQQINPGMIFKLYPNESIETLVPNFPIPELVPFIIMLCRRIGAALGICWQMVLRDFGDANYSAARTNLLESRQTFTSDQNFFIENLLSWEWEIVLFDAWQRGDSRLAGVTREELRMVHWIPPGWRWVDPVKEAEQARIELEIGTTTKRDVCAAKGQDWEEITMQSLLEEKFEADQRKSLGLPPKVTKEQAAVAKIDAAQSDEGGQDDAETA